MSKKISGEEFASLEAKNTCDHGNSKEKNLRKDGSGGLLFEDSLFSGLEFFEEGDDHISEQDLLSSQYYEEQLQIMARVGALDDLHLDVVSPPFHQSCGEEIRLLSQKTHQESSRTPSPFASLEFFKNRRRENITTNRIKIHETARTTKNGTNSPSTNYLIELAAGKFIQSNSENAHEELSDDTSFSCLSREDEQGVELLQDLLSSAERVGNQQFDSASQLIEKCRTLSSSKKNAIDRLVYYFSKALSEKIERETGKYNRNDEIKQKWCRDSGLPTAGSVAFYSKYPLIQVIEFTGVQTIVDSVSGRKKVHVLDLAVRCGVVQTILMQALASRSESPLENLKITAVATKKSKETIEKTGIRLTSLAESLNLNFSFHIVSIEDITNLPSEFAYDREETIVVHASHVLNRMIAEQNQLETLMRVVRRINPRIMIVSEAEANVNSPLFVNRFVEALFFYGAHFDCFEDCMRDDPTVRKFAESELMGPTIRNIVAAEGEERKFRIVGIEVWRAFFARFGMVETELSKSSLYHARLTCGRFEIMDSCTLDMDGKALIVGWKGSPIYSLSAWKFQGIRRFY